MDARHHHGGEHGMAADRHGDGAEAGGRESARVSEADQVFKCLRLMGDISFKPPCAHMHTQIYIHTNN